MRKNSCSRCHVLCRLALFLSILLLWGNAQATMNERLGPPDSFDFDLIVNYTEYEEEDLMEEDGFMYGIGVKYSYHGNYGLMLQAGVEYTTGDLDYDGQTWGGVPVDEGSDDWIVHTGVLADYDIWIDENLLLTPCIGVGTLKSPR